MKKGTAKVKKDGLSFVKQAYTMDYLIQNPPSNAKGLKLVWQTAVTCYVAEQGIDLTNVKNYKKPLANINFAAIVKIFQELSGAVPAKVATKKSSKKTA